MSWFVEAYENGTLQYILKNTNKVKGTAVLPTGAGKSGVVYEDMVYHINNRKEGEKLVFNLTAPILKLEAQLLNDFISVAKEIFADKVDNGEFMFFINSSADGNAYDAEYLNADVKNFNKIEDFKASKIAKIAIIASCHKSLYKFAEKVDYLNEFATTFTYSDEAHLMVNETRDDLAYNALSDESKKRWDSLTEVFKCDYFYALTATPDKYITAELNKAACEKENDYHIIDVPARELIAENKILPVKTWIQRVGNGDNEKITPEICSAFMESVKEDNPNIQHKVLVTCQSSSHLNYLREELGKAGYTVFSTCSKDGGRLTEDEDFIDVDEVEFVNNIDAHDGDCFVLHIKQLTQGIDVKTLTDCIYYNSTRVNDGVKRTILQTIGRTLRPLKGERGKTIEERLKKYGNVLFLIGDDDYDAVVNQMTAFLIKYYGRDGIKSFSKDIERNYGGIGKTKRFGSGNSGFGDDFDNFFETLIDALLVDMEDYIKKNVLPKHKAFMKLSGNKPNPKLLPMAVASVKNKFAHYKGVYDTQELLSDTEFMKAVSDLFAKYDIE